MLACLKTHPFPVEAFFEHSLVLTFAVPKDELAALLPAPLVPDSFTDDWGFLAVALVQTRHLRPKGFPAWLGQDFFLIGYRAFVRYPSPTGKRLRGLYILRSETDKKRMTALGNLFTHYRYHTIDLTQQTSPSRRHLESRQADFQVTLGPPAAEVALPAGSPFATWAEARRFAGPLPFTFSVGSRPGEMLIVEGVREHWQPQPVAVESYHIGFLEKLGFSQLRLANAFTVRNIPYSWKKGRTEQWYR